MWELNYFGARYYDADAGLWTSVDPMRQFWSGYSYTGNGVNPISSIDPNGLHTTLIVKDNVATNMYHDPNNESHNVDIYNASDEYSLTSIDNGEVSLDSYFYQKDKFSGEFNIVGQ